MTNIISRQVKTIEQLVSEFNIHLWVNRPRQCLGTDATSEAGGLLSL